MRRISVPAAVALGVSALLAAGVAAQRPAADTEIFVAAVTNNGGALSIGTLTNVSQSPGYDNQPSFLPGGRSVLYSSSREGRPQDIYRYDLDSRQTTRLTQTDESEFSPLVTPDGRTFSVIRVEADGAQRLWRFNLDGSNPRLVLEHVKPVGYHVWIDATHLGLFVLGGEGNPMTLQLADTSTGRAEVVASNIGRSLLRRPGAPTISFVHKPTGGRWQVRTIDPTTREIVTLVETAAERAEDTAWTPDGRLMMTSGTQLMLWTPGSAGWTMAADLAGHGVSALTRLALTGPADGPWTLALVGEPVAR
jgi:Tol biopolymer transport system component